MRQKHQAIQESARRGGEDALTRWLRRYAPRIGDDAAFLEAGGPWAVTVDSQREGVHFEPGRAPQAIARRLVAVNNSDMAACGAAPRYAFSTLAAPQGFDRRAFFRALIKELDRHGTELAGGDLSSGGKVEATLTLMGERVARGSFLQRASARPGDRIWLCGEVGQSRLGLELLARGASSATPTALPEELPEPLAPLARRCLRSHVLPEPKLELGHWLARRRRSCAAIDVSDGLAKDLSRLCQASNVGCRLNLGRIPRHRRFGPLAEWLGIHPVTAILAGGEDYALLACAPPGTRIPPRFDCRQIGEVLAPEEGCLLVDPDGSSQELAIYSQLGFDHLT